MKFLREQHDGFTSENAFACCARCDIGVFVKLTDLLTGGWPVHNNCLASLEAETEKDRTKRYEKS